MYITTTLSIFQGFFWYFQVLGHFWARIMSMHHFSRFLSSPRLLPELLEVAKWGSKPVSCFFSLVGTHTSLNAVMWTLSWKWFSTHYILKMDYCTLLLICSKMCQFCSLQNINYKFTIIWLISCENNNLKKLFGDYFETCLSSEIFSSNQKILTHFRLNLTTVCRYGTLFLENKSEGDFCW